MIQYIGLINNDQNQLLQPLCMEEKPIPWHIVISLGTRLNEHVLYNLGLHKTNLSHRVNLLLVSTDQLHNLMQHNNPWILSYLERSGNAEEKEGEECKWMSHFDV